MEGDVDRPLFLSDSGVVSGAAFFAHVKAVAKKLPDAAYAINFCANRFDFAVALFAALLRGQTTVLLPGHQPAMLQAVRQRFTDAYVIGVSDPEDNPFGFADINATAFDPNAAANAPEVPAAQTAVVVFTSGTTGDSKPLFKSVACLYEGARINAGAFDQYFGDACKSVVATVPPWHMYGLEWSVMLPMVKALSSFSGPTLFPENVTAAIAIAGSEHCLISTPHHLRALVRAVADVSVIDNVVSATAPLGEDLARRLADNVSGDLLEVYGCSEAGSVAARRFMAGADSSPTFDFFPAFSAATDGDSTVLRAVHVPEEVVLADVLQFDEDEGFRIVGRDSDLIKVAGKRASLAALNAVLLSLDFVEDGSFYSFGDDLRLSVVVVLKEGRQLGPRDITSALNGLIEPAFLPRRVRIVDELPRNETGKLQRRKLESIVVSSRESAS